MIDEMEKYWDEHLPPSLIKRLDILRSQKY